MKTYILVENKRQQTKNGDMKSIIKIGELVQVGKHSIIKNELTFWVNEEYHIFEGTVVEPDLAITQKDFAFKVYLNNLVEVSEVELLK